MGCKGLPIGFPNPGQWKSKLHKWNHFHHVPPVRGHTGSQISGKLLEVSPMLAAHLRDHPNIKHDNKLLGNCDLYMGYSPKIYAIDLSLSLSHSWSNHEFLFRFQPFGEGVLQGMLCLAPWDHKPCDEETYHGQISNYKSVRYWTYMNIQGTWCSIRRLSRNHWNGWRCLHQFLDHWILRRWWNLNQHLSAAALCREILDVVAAIHVLAQTHCAVAQSAGMGGKWVLVSLGPLIT